MLAKEREAPGGAENSNSYAPPGPMGPGPAAPTGTVKAPLDGTSYPADLFVMVTVKTVFGSRLSVPVTDARSPTDSVAWLIRFPFMEMLGLGRLPRRSR